MVDLDLIKKALERSRLLFPLGRQSTCSVPIEHVWKALNEVSEILQQINQAILTIENEHNLE